MSSNMSDYSRRMRRTIVAMLMTASIILAGVGTALIASALAAANNDALAVVALCIYGIAAIWAIHFRFRP